MKNDTELSMIRIAALESASDLASSHGDLQKELKQLKVENTELLEDNKMLLPRNLSLKKNLDQLNESYSSLYQYWSLYQLENAKMKNDITKLAKELDTPPRFTRLSQVSRKFNMPRARVYDIICNYKHPLKPISPNLKVSDEQIAYLKGYIRGTDDDCIVSGEDLRTALLKPTKEELFITKEELKEQLNSYFNIGL